MGKNNQNFQEYVELFQQNEKLKKQKNNRTAGIVILGGLLLAGGICAFDKLNKVKNLSANLLEDAENKEINLKKEIEEKDQAIECLETKLSNLLLKFQTLEEKLENLNLNNE